MKLNNFKELLLKKSEDNDSLQLLIKYMRDDYLVDHVVESLEKMAQAYSKKNTNAAVMHYGTHMDKETDGGMIHDALSHHASHYKAANAAGDKGVADQHMKKIFNVMHMSDKLTRDGLNDHSGGKLNVEAIDPKPWERAGYPNKSAKNPSKFSTDTRGWSRSSGNQNYDYLRNAPHESYKGEIKTHGHNGAYPLEEIKVNGKHLHIDDVDHSGGFASHVMDDHPVMKHYSNSPKNHGEDAHSQYLDDHDKFYDEGGGIDKHWNNVEARDPAEHEVRGSVKSDPVHEEVDGLDLSDSQPSKENTEKVTSLQDRLKSIREMGNK